MKSISKVNIRAFISFCFIILLGLIAILFFLVPLEKKIFSRQQWNYRHYYQLKKSLEPLRKKNFVQAFVRENSGFKLYLNAEKLFVAQSESLLVSSHDLLDSLAKILRSFGKKFLIAGYVDKTPLLGTVYSSHWELAANRSIKLVRYMVNQHKIEPERFVVLSYASYTKKKFLKASILSSRSHPKKKKLSKNRIELTLTNTNRF